MKTSTSCSCGNVTLRVEKCEARAICARCGDFVIARPSSGNVIHKADGRA